MGWRPFLLLARGLGSSPHRSCRRSATSTLTCSLTCTSTPTSPTCTQVSAYLQSACSCTLHPLHHLVSSLAEAYNVSYGGVGAHRSAGGPCTQVRSHPVLLPHAMAELASITTRLYQVHTTTHHHTPQHTTTHHHKAHLQSP